VLVLAHGEVAERLPTNSCPRVDTEGRLCRQLPNLEICCLPCPMTDWAYPDAFDTLGATANWVSVVSTVACLFLLLSWAVLPVEKTFRHYLSICLTTSVLLMNVCA